MANMYLAVILSTNRVKRFSHFPSRLPSSFMLMFTHSFHLFASDSDQTNVNVVTFYMTEMGREEEKKQSTTTFTETQNS